MENGSDLDRHAQAGAVREAAPCASSARSASCRGGGSAPHDVEILIEPSDGAAEGQIDRIVHLGFEVRVELSLGEGDSTWVQTTRAQAEELELAEGQIVWLRPEVEPVSAWTRRPAPR